MVLISRLTDEEPEVSLLFGDKIINLMLVHLIVDKSLTTSPLVNSCGGGGGCSRGSTSSCGGGGCCRGSTTSGGSSGGGCATTSASSSSSSGRGSGRSSRGC